MPKSSAFVANGLTAVAEAELKALSILANMWSSRNATRLSASVNGSSPALQHLAAAAVFAVAVRSAVAFEFPGRKNDGMGASSSEASQYSPAFAASLSNLNRLSLTWSVSSSNVVASVPLPYPTRFAARLPPRRSARPCTTSCPSVPSALSHIFRSERGVFAVAGVVIPAAVMHSVMAHAFPAMCDGILFLCWMIDERGYVLHARDFLCPSAAGSCGGQRLSTLRPRVASSLVSSGIFEFRSINASSSVMHSMHRRRSLASATVAIAAAHDGILASAEQQLEISVFNVKDTSATVAVLSGKGMQVSNDVDIFVFLLPPFGFVSHVLQPVMDATRPGFFGNVQPPCAGALGIHVRSDDFAADCGPMGIICSNLQPLHASPQQFYSPSSAATLPQTPVLLAPFHSDACDFSTPAWVWAVVGTCAFLFCGTIALAASSRARIFLLNFLIFAIEKYCLHALRMSKPLAPRSHAVRSVAVLRPRRHPHVPQASSCTHHDSQPRAQGAIGPAKAAGARRLQGARAAAAVDPCVKRGFVLQYELCGRYGRSRCALLSQMP
jgi:hypothetical protein